MADEATLVLKLEAVDDSRTLPQGPVLQAPPKAVFSEPDPNDVFARKMAWEKKELERLQKVSQEPKPAPLVEPKLSEEERKRQYESVIEPGSPAARARDARFDAEHPQAIPLLDEQEALRSINQKRADRERQEEYNKLRYEHDPEYRQQVQQAEQEREEKKRKDAAKKLQDEHNKMIAAQKQEAHQAGSILAIGANVVGGEMGKIMNIAGMAVAAFPKLMAKSEGEAPVAKAASQTEAQATVAKATSQTEAQALVAASKIPGTNAKVLGNASPASVAEEAAAGTAGAGGGMAAAAGVAGFAAAAAAYAKSQVDDKIEDQRAQIQGTREMGQAVLSQDPEKMLAKLRDGLGSVAESAGGYLFGKQLKEATGFLFSFREEIQHTSERLSLYHGGLASALAEQESQRINRDIHRASRFGDDFTRLQESRNRVDVKLAQLTDRLTPIFVKFAEGCLGLLEALVNGVDGGVKLVSQALLTIVEFLQSIPVAGNNQALISIVAFLRQIAQDAQPDSNDGTESLRQMLASVRIQVNEAQAPAVGNGGGNFPGFGG